MIEELQIIKPTKVHVCTCGKAVHKKGRKCRECYRGWATPVMHHCVICSTSFKHRRNSENKCCSRACGFKWLELDRAKDFKKWHDFSYPKAPKHCDWCGMSYSGESQSLFCSDNCRRKRNNKKACAMFRREKDCVVCGASFLKEYKAGFVSFCSVTCKDFAESLAVKKHRRISKNKRRAKMRSCTVVSFDPLDVLQRDNWRCQICGQRTPRKLRGTNDPRAPELDHITPLALGGAHAPWNTQCACRSCNGTKGATVVGQFLLAI